MGESSIDLNLANFEIEVSDQGLRKLVWRRFRAPRQPAALESKDLRKAAEAALMDYFSGRSQSLAKVKLDFRGAAVSPKAQKVYRALQRTRCGETLTYAELAVRSGLSSKAARYVGTLMAQNPWPLFVPCHRVLPATYKKTGVGSYSGGRGTETKLSLLRFEGALQ